VATVNRHVTSTDGTIVPSLLDYLSVVGRRKFIFLLILLLVPATAIAVSLAQGPTYRASAEVLSRQLGTTYIDPQRLAETRADLARVPAVVDPVLEEVPSAGLDRKEFLDSSSVSATLGTDILSFAVENSDPRIAMQLATEYANSFTEYQQQLDNEAIADDLDQVRQQLAQLEANGQGPGSPEYDALQRREEIVAAAAAAETQTARVVTPALEAPKVGPRTLRNALIAVGLGLVLALVVVFLVDALDTRVRSVDTVRETLGLRLLGRLSPPPSDVRKRNGLVMLADPTSREAEQFRALRWSLELANEHGAKTIMVTSAVDAEGKSTTVANLAVALARAGRKVVVIDADLRKPYLHRLFNLEQQPGLTDVELGDAGLTDALQSIAVTEDSAGGADLGKKSERLGSLEVLPAGSTLQDPDELGFDRALGGIITRIQGRAEIVLVDTSPLLRSDAIALSAEVDAIVVVVRLKGVRASALEEMGWILDAAPATKLGFIVTGAEKGKGYGYGQQQRVVTSSLRSAGATPPGAADSPSSVDGDGATPVAPPTRSAKRPFGGLSPREAALRSAQSRRRKSEQRPATTEHTEPEPGGDANGRQ
jgi:capsular exopolysaccharide synthesis family protein